MAAPKSTVAMMGEAGGLNRFCCSWVVGRLLRTLAPIEHFFMSAMLQFPGVIGEIVHFSTHESRLGRSKLGGDRPLNTQPFDGSAAPSGIPFNVEMTRTAENRSRLVCVPWRASLWISSLSRVLHRSVLAATGGVPETSTFAAFGLKPNQSDSRWSVVLVIWWVPPYRSPPPGCFYANCRRHTRQSLC